MDSQSRFDVIVSCKGRNEAIFITASATPADVFAMVMTTLGLDAACHNVKLVLKGKRLDATDSTTSLFDGVPKKTPRIMALVTTVKDAKSIAEKKSDPTIRGFAQEAQRTERLQKQSLSSGKAWGSLGQQDRNYRFVKIEACTWQSFGHRPTESTPHAFEAYALLEKLASDPGVVAIMKERELVVNALGEMDPVDDRLMQKTQQGGGCLLGYNTNHGLRIDIKLRTDNLAAFRPYSELVGTLIHELSHNWVGEHNLLFWTNYAQMRAEYLYKHRRLLSSALIKGQTTAQIAGLPKAGLDNVCEFILQELVREMAQHGLHPRMIAAALRQRCDELEQFVEIETVGRRLGDGVNLKDGNGQSLSVHVDSQLSPRERALAAAERRAKEQREKRG
eukprot:CAMPEP_0119561278 /NCGR_PEP_ID=MMETSP1352-20130426/17156_1 /TAXON_ID=265584 /ORGANISM="Stauroneis constricta, Strain CCMP1120" /LENGTH=390 /DNA_ID=CAMNT_0007609449 /DNA_START=97 /DNA_END=1266 /DNA_ORIENTATION=+